MNRKIALLLALCLFLLISNGISAQSIEGTVRNDGKNPMANAHVYAEQLNKTLITNKDGEFVFYNLPEGYIKLRVSHVGYKTQTKTFKITRKENYIVTFNMKSETTSLPEVSVTDIGERNNRTATISRGYLERTQALDLKDIFAAEPSVVVGGGGENARRLYLRGIEGSNLNITIDGAKQGRSLFQHRGNAGNIDATLLKQVEISTGTDASQKTGGLGGSIAFETIDAQDLLSSSKKIGATLATSFVGITNGYSTRAIFGNRFGKYIGLLLSASYDNQDNYRTAKQGLALNTAFKMQNYLAKLSIIDYNHQELRINTTYNRSTGHYISGGAGSDMGIPSDTLAAQYQVMERSSYSIDYRYKPNSPWLKLRVGAYYNHRNLANKDSEINVTSNNFGASIKNEFRFKVGVLSNAIIIGSDFECEDGKSASAKALGGIEQTNTSSSWGLFTQGKSKLSIFSLSYGIRRDNYSSDLGPYKLKGDRFLPNIDIDMTPFNGLHLYGNYGKTIRAGGTIPIQWMSNITEKTNFNDGKAFKPESSIMQEAGIRYERKKLFTDNDIINVGIKIFRTEMNNLIERVGGGGGPVSKIWNDSLGIKSTGYEVNVGWSNSFLQARLNYVHVKMEDKEGNLLGISRRKIAPIGDRFNLDISWRINSEVETGYTLTAVKRLTKVVGSERPGYATHNIQAIWHPKSITGFTTSFAINNLLNKQYCEQTSIESKGTVMPEPGRDIRLTLAYNF